MNAPEQIRPGPADDRRGSSRTRLCLSFTTLILAGLLTVCCTLADEQSDRAANENEERRAQAREILEHMQRMRFESVQENARQPVALIDHPLLKYTDPVRANDQGTVWGWGPEGRPLALMEVFRPSGVGQLVHAVTLTSTELVVGTVSDQQRWSPQTSSIKFQSMRSVSKPAERDPQRLAQLKDLARKFEAFEIWDPNNSRFELRLLVQPIHRYRDPRKGIVDGAIFLLAHGTNPEVALLIEAQGKAVDTSEWRFAMARLGSAELHVSFDGEEVWKQPRTPNVVGESTDPYWLFFTDSKRDGK